MKKIYVTGISGTGKTSIARLLEEEGVYCISIDETPGLCHWRHKETKEAVDYEAELNEGFINTHEWICDAGKLRELIDTDKIVVVTGIAGNQTEYLHLFDEVLLLQCQPETFIARIMQRTDNDFGKDESAQKVILGWYKDFEKDMLDHGAKSVDAEKQLEEVLAQVFEYIS